MISDVIMKTVVMVALISVPFVVSEIGPKGPDFCATKLLTAAFTDHKNQIRLIKDDWIWTYNQSLNRVSAAIRRDSKEPYDVQSVAYISAVPACFEESGSSKCPEINRFKSLVIIVYKGRNTGSVGDYQVKRMLKGSIARLDPMTELPFGLKLKGNIFSSKEIFWPKILTVNADISDIKGAIIVYNPVDFQLSMLVNGRIKGWICVLSLEYNKKWNPGTADSVFFAPKWKCESAPNDRRFIGGFVKNSNTYVVAINDRDNRLLTVNTAHQLIDTNIDIQNYLGCGLKIKPFILDNGEDADTKEKGNDNSSFTFVLLVIALIIIISIIALIVFFSSRKTSDDKEDSKSESVPGKGGKKKDKRDKNKQNPITGKPVDSKGKEVDETQIGALDSKVNWDIVVATPSVGSDDGTPIPDSEMAKMLAKTKASK